MENKSKILPPANGRKLWRVRLASASAKKAVGSNFSMECFNNSMKISAAGTSFLTRRPPSKRPKNKPGMPKDFVFVDLLPVKTQEAEMTGSNDLASISSAPTSASASTSGSLPPSPTSDDDSIFSNLDSATMMSELDGTGAYVQDTFSTDTRAEMGLGIMNIDFGMGWQSQEAASGAAELAPLAYSMNGIDTSSTPHFNNFVFGTTRGEDITSNTTMQPRGHKRAYTVDAAPNLKRSKSTTDRRRSGEIQFKAYHAPVAGPRKQLNHRHTMSAPVVPQIKSQQPQPVSNLEDFMLLNEQITVFLNDSDTSDAGEYSPVSEFVPEVDNTKLSNFKGCANDQFMAHKPEEFDFNSFVTF